MSPQDLMIIEDLLITDEQVVWMGRPLIKPYKVRNVRRTIIEFLQTSAFFSIALSVLYLVLRWAYSIPPQKDSFSGFDLYNLGLFMVLIFVINLGKLIRKIIQADKILYCITNKRVMIIKDLKKETKVKTIDKREIRNKKIVTSDTDAKYKVQTVELLTGDEERDMLLEAIEDGDKAMGLL